MPAVDSDKLIEALRRQQRHSSPTIELALERVIAAVEEAASPKGDGDGIQYRSKINWGSAPHFSDHARHCPYLGETL
jgi:hypothetical protein